MREKQSKIMVIDDTAANLKLLENMLRNEGYQVLSFPNGDLALKGTEKNPPDLILLDINMPGMDGYEVCKRLKKKNITKNTPVIFVTAKGEVEDEEKGFTVGAVDYIVKPLNLPIVKARIKTHLSLKNARQELKVILSRTLNGSVKVLMDILNLAKPEVFNRSLQIKHLVVEMAKAFELKDIWKYELAALFSNIGCINMPVEIMDKIYSGEELTDNEKEIYSASTARGVELIAHIPNLETVVEIINRLQDPVAKIDNTRLVDSDPIDIGEQLLKTAMGYLQLKNLETPVEAVIKKMKTREKEYDPVLLNVLEEVLVAEESGQVEVQVELELAVRKVLPKMFLKQDVYSKKDVLLFVKGTQLSLPNIELLREFDQKDGVKGPIRVFVPPDYQIDDTI